MVHKLRKWHCGGPFSGCNDSKVTIVTGSPETASKNSCYVLQDLIVFYCLQTPTSSSFIFFIFLDQPCFKFAFDSLLMYLGYGQYKQCGVTSL